MILLILFVFLVALYFSYIKHVRYWMKNNVPFKMPLPFVGHMVKPLFRREHMVTVVDENYQKFPNSPFFGLLSFKDPILVLKDPELIKQVTVKDFEAFPIHKGFVDEEMDPLWSKNLFAIQELNKWRQLRATLSPTFTSSKMRVMFELMQECAKNFTNYYLKKNDDSFELDIKEAFRHYANDVIASTAFGISCDSLNEEDNKFFQMGKDVSNFGGIRALKFFLYSFSPKLMKMLNISMFGKKTSEFFMNLVSENIRMREEQNIVRPDMINLLLEARKGKSKKTKAEDTEIKGFAEVEESEFIQKETQYLSKLTDEDITAQAMIFFFAGFETTAVLMSFVMAELAVNPNIQNKLAEEITKVHEKSEGKIKYEDVQNLKYLDMVMSETLRKWNLSAFFDRVVATPYTIYDNDGKPLLNLKKGDNVWIPGYSLHRDPKNFPNPDKFDPERFSDERKHEIKPFTYLPFGSGPRNCIGSRFALLEAKTVLFHLLLNFEVYPTSKTPLPLKLDPATLVVQLKGGFNFGLRKRYNKKQY